MLSSSRSSRTPKKSLIYQHNEIGLKSLTVLCSDVEQQPLRLHSCIVRSKILSPSSSPSSTTPQICFNAETMSMWGVGDVKNDEEERKCKDEKWGRRRRRKIREFPPPLPLLARTEKLSCQMPWVLKRIYQSDGRLIIQQEWVKRHEYFRVQRGNGRLILKLVELEDNSLRRSHHTNEEKTLETEKEEEREREGENINVEEDNEEKSEHEDEEEKSIVEEEGIIRERSSVMMIGASSMPESCHGIGNGLGGAGLMNDSRSLGSELFRMPIPTIRPVHS